jgi:hypothetical protein
MWCHKSQVVLESFYWQQLSDEIISIHEVAIYCNKSQIISDKKDADLATVSVCGTQYETRRKEWETQILIPFILC